MEELQKSNERKVEEISRSKLTEDFEAVTSFFQGSNVKTIYNFGDNDAKYPDAEIDDVHTGNSAGFSTVPSGARTKCEPVAGFHSQRESLFQRAQSIFSKYGETRYWMSQKAQI